jgi:hypothetical protein
MSRKDTFFLEENEGIRVFVKISFLPGGCNNRFCLCAGAGGELYPNHSDN